MKQLTRLLVILLVVVVVCSLFNVWAAVADLSAQHVTTVHFGSSSKKLWKFEIDNNTTCYYMQSGLDGNPALSCMYKPIR